MKAKEMRIVIFVALGLLAGAAVAAESISITATPRYPWNGKVDLKFTIDGTSGTKYDTSFTAKDVAGGTNLTMKTLYKSNGTAANVAKEQLLPGTYNWVWDATADLGEGTVLEKVVVEGNVLHNEADHKQYMVVDLSAGPNASTYPICYLDAEPSDGWTDEFKTTKLVLRHINAGTFVMGSPNDEMGRDMDYGNTDDEKLHVVKLNDEFYIGVFEITQAQYKNIIGTNPSKYVGALRPVEEVSWNDIRGDGSSRTEIGSMSFCGKLRARTKMMFDLPTDAQWEYACRAGSTTALNNGMNISVGYCVWEADENLNLLGRYNQNCDDGKGGFTQHTVVGLYKPNALGLYDMHGNITEFVRDYFTSEMKGVDAEDPEGVYDDKYHKGLRGGGWVWQAYACRCAVHIFTYASNRVADNGFRIALTIKGGGK